MTILPEDTDFACILADYLIHLSREVSFNKVRLRIFSRADKEVFGCIKVAGVNARKWGHFGTPLYL